MIKSIFLQGGIITMFLIYALFNILFAQEIIDKFKKEGKKVTELESGVIIIVDPELEKLEEQRVDAEDTIEDIEEEIKVYEAELENVQTKKESLETEVKKLNITNRRATANVKLVEGNISKTNIDLGVLAKDIELKSEELVNVSVALRRLFQNTNALEIEKLPQIIFISADIFSSLNKIESSKQVQEMVIKKITQLEYLSDSLEENRDIVSQEKTRLNSLHQELDARQKILSYSIREKEDVLVQTQNEESGFQAVLEQKREERESLEREILEYESQIDLIIDPNSLPEPGTPVFRLPFNIGQRITQRFGRTPYAIRNSRQYGNAFHPGVDYATPNGTKIFSAGNGRVLGTGDTDTLRTCQSWGKWVAIEHNNGLTTLYAHLSIIRVNEGEAVKSGDLIGYSGNTGFSTGPHLHFGVYASIGLKIVPYETISSSSKCRGLNVPVASNNAKLNPLDYLQK